ncbi:MAG: hypothetical protein C0608_11970 [Deltaproteobacteria bacterium]|nr:MAG: hypothetical protein C0608_11970 [Deltaproteobacteria bacterium]
MTPKISTESEEAIGMGGEFETSHTLRNVVYLIFAVLFTFNVGTAFLGADYGVHWDEHFMQELLEESVNDLSAWPSKYFYGSFYSTMGYAGLLPEWVGALPELTSEAFKVGQYSGRITPTTEIKRIQEGLNAKIKSNSFLVRLRYLFILVASAGLFFQFSAARDAGDSPMAGLFSAAVIALSWEINTHSRHIAIDSTLVMMTALFFAFLTSYLKGDGENRPTLLYVSALVAGMSTGTKFTALALLIPVLVVVILQCGKVGRVETFKRLSISIIISFAALLLVNPGLILDTVNVANDWGYTSRDYTRETSTLLDSYRTTGRLDHLKQAVSYVTTSALSPNILIALALDLFALIGLVVSLKRHREFVFAAALFFVAYLMIITSSGLAIVRNYLPLVVPLALFSGIGISFTLKNSLGRSSSYVVLAFFLLWTGVNGQRMFSTAWSVAEPTSSEERASELVDYIAQNPEQRFLVTASVDIFARAGGIDLSGLRNVRVLASKSDRPSYDHLVYLLADYYIEAPGVPRRGYFDRVIGTKEVNYDYYPDWVGRNPLTRIYVIDRQKAELLYTELGF